MLGNFKRIIEYIEAVEKSRTITSKTTGNVNYELQLKQNMKDIKINFVIILSMYVNILYRERYLCGRLT